MDQFDNWFIVDQDLLYLNSSSPAHSPTRFSSTVSTNLTTRSSDLLLLSSNALLVYQSPLAIATHMQGCATYLGTWKKPHPNSKPYPNNLVQFYKPIFLLYIQIHNNIFLNQAISPLTLPLSQSASSFVLFIHEFTNNHNY